MNIYENLFSHVPLKSFQKEKYMLFFPLKFYRKVCTLEHFTSLLTPMAQRWSSTASSISWALQTTQTDQEFLEAGVDDFIQVEDEKEPMMPDEE